MSNKKSGKWNKRKRESLAPVWKKATGWAAALVELLKALAGVGLTRDKHDWKCCDLEHQMRKHFPKKARKGEKSREDFCNENCAATGIRLRPIFARWNTAISTYRTGGRCWITTSICLHLVS